MAIKEKEKQYQPPSEKQLVSWGMRCPVLKLDRTTFAKTEEEKQRLKIEKSLWKKS
jgi:hypothetical protein